MDPELVFYAAAKYAGSPDDPVPDDVRRRVLAACFFRMADTCPVAPGPEGLLLQARYALSQAALPDDPGFAAYSVTVSYRWIAA